MPLLTLYPGNIYWVDSNGGGGSKGTFSHPVATLDAALALCTNDNGDIICLKPGHTESLSATQAVDKSGVAIVGLGVNASRPTFTGIAATDDFDVQSDDVCFYNIIFKHTTANATAIINVGAESPTISNCRFELGANALQAIVIEYDKDDVTVEDCEFHVTANGPDAAITIEKSTTSSPARIKILRNLFNGGNATNAWDNGDIFADGIATDILVKDNLFMYMLASKGGVEFTAASTGMIANNLFAGGTLGQMIDPGSCLCFENYEADAIDESGRLFPTSAAS
jgi:hypothetical protein